MQRVFEFAKDVGMETMQLMTKLREWNIPVKSHMAELDESMIALIRQKMDEGQKAEQAAKKKVTRKKTTSEAAPAAAKAPKAPKAEPATKAAPKAAPKAAAAGGATKASAKKAAASTVIRRKATEMAESRAEAEAAQIPPTEAPQVQASAAVATAPEVEVASSEGTAAPVAPVPAGAPAPAMPTQAVAAPSVTPSAPEPRRPSVKREVIVEAGPERGRNIVGRMDLSRAQGPGFQRGFGGSGASVSSGPARARNIRTGFVASAAPPMPIPEDRTARRDDRRRRPGAPGTGEGFGEGATKEEETVPIFSAAEFRKREMIFQPKKKKGMLNRESLKTQITTPKASKRVVKIHDKVQVSEFAKAMGTKATAIVSHLMKNGMMVTMNDWLDFDTATLIAPEFGFEVENVKETAEDIIQTTAFGDLNAEKVRRPPIVTVMGHVDHGKTSLLDAIRKTDVAAGEAGGITQHIGAYSVKLEDGHTITFIDTPGHAAFTAMRARGANVTDVAIIVVASDDGAMPQTIEAISHAKAAGVPIIVAVNKMDKPGANPDRIKQQLTEQELVPEEWGGTTIYCPVSALKKTGIKELLEQVVLVAEVADLKANPSRSATGVVIEAKMEKGRGVVATLLVKDGTMKVGQSIAAGGTWGRVRAMINDRGQNMVAAGPSEPVEILGLESVPAAGDRFDVCKNDDEAERIAQARKEETEKKTAVPSSKMSLEDLFSKVQTGDVKELPIVLKCDVAGSSEAIQGMLAKEVSDKVKVKIVHTGVGGINESDILLASTAKGIVIGFNVRPDSGALNLAKREGIEIKTYTIIYNLMDELKKAMEGLLEPDIVEKVMGHAEVRNVFTVPKVGAIAGCFVQDGKVARSGLVRVLRQGRIIYDGKVGSLKRFKDDAREVASGFECGLGVENFNDVKVGDVLEVYEKETVQKTL